MTTKTPKPLFNRVVVKLSGEALMGPDTHGLHAPTMERMAADLKAAADLGVQVAVVVGGGNFFRGLQGADKGIERARADSIGMLATVMNALAMEGALEQIDQPFVHDPAKSVAQAVKEAEKTVGAPIAVKGFVRYALGEGIEKAAEEA